MECDDYCKSFVDNPNVKLPLVYVDKHGKVFLNEIAKKWESPEKIERSLRARQGEGSKLNRVSPGMQSFSSF